MSNEPLDVDEDGEVQEPPVPEGNLPIGYMKVLDNQEILLPSMTPAWENDEAIWLIQPGESNKWYKRFERYYLMIGMGRSIMNAERLYRQEVGLPVQKRHTASNNWTMAAKRYHWRDRADAWDRELNLRASDEVARSMTTLRMATPKAVATLILKLTDPKLAVAAAKEILDRGGIPAVTKQTIAHTVEITSDEMADATKDAEEWEKQMMSDENG